MGNFLSGTWGQITSTFVVSLLVVIVEYLIVKPWLEGPAGGGGSQSVFIYIERAVPSSQQPPVASGRRAPTEGKSSGSDDEVWLWIAGAAAAAFITAAAFLSAYVWVVNVIVGADVGLAIFALSMYRRTVLLPIPQVRFWIAVSTVTAVVAVLATFGTAFGRYKGHTIGDLRGEVSNLSWLDAITELIHRYDSSVMFFLAYKALGVLVILLACLYNVVILIGITAALNAFTTGHIRTVRGWLIRHILPLASGKRHLLLIPFIVFWILGLALTSGSVWNWVNDSTLIPTSVPTIPSTPSPSPSVFPPTTAPPS